MDFGQENFRRTKVSTGWSRKKDYIISDHSSGLAKENTVGIETVGMSAAEKNGAVNSEEARRFPRLDTR